MQIVKTALATAVVMALSQSAYAIEAMPSIPDASTVDELVEQTNASASIDSGLTSFDSGKTALVLPKQGQSNGGASASFIQTLNSGSNNGTIWVLAGKVNGENYGKYAGGLEAYNGGEVVNHGTIYVKAGNGLWNLEAAKAMSAGAFADKSSVATNKGKIVVDGAAGMVVTNAGTGKKATLVNDGVITVLNSGFAMSAGKNDVSGVQIINSDTATIFVEGKSAVGLTSSDAKNTKMQNTGEIQATNGAKGVYLKGTNNAAVNTGLIISDETSTSVYLSSKTSSFVNEGTIDAKGTAIYALNGTVTLKDNSQVNGLVDTSKNTTIKFENNSDSLLLKDDVGTLSVDNNSQVIIEQGTDSALTVGTLSVDKASNAQFKLRRIANEGETILSVSTIDGEGKDAVAVGYAGNVSDELLQGADAKLLTSGVSLGGETVESVTVDQGLSGDEMIVYKDGSSETVRAHSLITSAQDVAVASALMWRDQLSSLSDRMGTLRTMPGEVGSWARYTNGRMDGNDIEHDFNTIEVGFDKKINNTVALGASFAYTKGDTDVIAGTADNNTYTGGLYATYMNESNCFFNAMLKIGRIDAEYDLMTSAGAESADYMMTGTIFGIEAGHRWNVQNFYVEPALQVTYSHIRPASYTSSIERQVKYEAMESLIAKVGVTGGMTFAEKGAAFAAVSYNHDFMGDVEGRYTHNSITRTFEDELDDNWGEAKLGASYQVTNGLNAFADVATTFGGDIDQKWRVNIGARYVF